VDEQTLRGFEIINHTLESNGMPYKLDLVNIDDVVIVEKNARYMTNETFKNLVANIRRDGGLTSVPLCWKRNGKYLILSGNHRIQAARSAGQTHVLIIYIEKNLTRQEQVAIQLSHNSIVGQDDIIILKQLWDEIEDIGIKYYAGLDDKILEELKKMQLQSLSEVNLEYRQITFIFLDEEVDHIISLFNKALKEISSKEVFIGKLTEFDRLMKGLAKTQAAYNIHNMATSFMLMLNIFENHYDDLAQGWEYTENAKNISWVPLASIFNTDNIPIEAARIIKKAIDKMKDRKNITQKNLWQAIEYWATDFINGS